MADKTYAWSNIIYGAEKDDQGNLLGNKVIAIGEPVSQSDLDVSDEEWQMLQDQEVVREYPLPDNLKDTFRSPRQLMQDKLIAAQEGFDMTGPTAALLERFDDEGELKPTEEIQVATGTPAPASTKANAPSDS